MPAVSRQQAKAMFAAASGHSTLGIPKKVGQEFTSGFHGHKGSVAKLPVVKKPKAAAPAKKTRHFGSMAPV